MADAPSKTSGAAAAKTTWVVICTPSAGEPFSEYVEGTKLVSDAMAGMLTILDGDQIVRSYAAGAWSNFAEWVTNTVDFFSGNVIRRRLADDPKVTAEPTAPNRSAPRLPLWE
jgi:hypothetical protein